MSAENLEPLCVKFIDNDQVKDNKLPFDDVLHYEMFDEDNEDESTTTWVRFKLKDNGKHRATGFITTTENILNMDQVQDNILRRVD